MEIEKQTKMRSCEELGIPWRKRPRHWCSNFITNLTQKQAYQLEKDCLLLLEKNFKCRCGLNAQHFPKIVSCNDDEFKFKLTHQGTSLDNLTAPIKVHRSDEQIDCIVENLKKNNIKHLDIPNAGGNLCINSKGVLSVIDFEIASIDDIFLTSDLHMRYRQILGQVELVTPRVYREIAHGHDKRDYCVSLKKIIKWSLDKYNK